MTGLLAATALAAAALSALAIGALRPWLLRYALARPNARSSHAAPTPQGGGIAVLAGAALAAGATLALGGGTETLRALWPLAAGTLALAITGAIDDVRPLPPLPRLLVQAAAVAGVVVGADPGRVLPDAVPAGVERALLLLAGIWWVNLVNFMDGLDWMTVAEFVPLAGALAAFGVAGWLPPVPATVAAGLLGGMAAFAHWNRPVARLFLGDVGALPLGLVSGWLLISLAVSGGLAAALLLPLYYLADATVTLLRRVRQGERVWEAHRTHFYQRARDHGHSVLAIDARVFALNLALAALAAATLAWPGPLPAVLALAAGGVLVGGTLRAFTRPPRPLL